MEHKCDKCGQLAALPDRGDILCIRGACNGNMKPLKAKTEPVAEVPCSDGVIKPCPFCGEQPEYSPAVKDKYNPPHGWPHQIVHDCNVIGAQFCVRAGKLSLQGEPDSKEVVVAAWNTRAL